MLNTHSDGADQAPEEEPARSIRVTPATTVM